MINLENIWKQLWKFVINKSVLEECELLNKAVKEDDNGKIKQHLYDMIYLILEIASDKNYDLDEELDEGERKKQIKYLSNK